MSYFGNIFLISGIGLMFISGPSCSVAQTHSLRPRSNVTIESVTKVYVAQNVQAYLVSFSYDFGMVPSVHLRGLGVLPPRGAYHYISKEMELEFLDSRSGSVLERVPMGETAVVAAKPPLNEIPPDSIFKKEGIHSFTWDAAIPLMERVNLVFGKYFLYSPHEDKQLIYLATTYTSLPLNRQLLENGVLAQIALLVSFPYDPTSGKYSFHIQYLLKEGRSLSDDFRPTSNMEIVKAANDFVGNLVNEMQTGK